MCNYCENMDFILKEDIEKFNDIYFFGSNSDEETMTIKEIKNAIDEEEVAVFIDRGFLRLTVGDDIGCLDHSLDRIEINYCPICGSQIIK